MVYNQKKKDALLREWDAAFSKSALKLWVLVALKDKDRSITRMQEFLGDVGLHVSDQALYRALRHWEKQNLIEFEYVQVKFGRAPRRYRLTPEGAALLNAILNRYIKKFYSPEIARIIKYQA